MASPWDRMHDHMPGDGARDAPGMISGYQFPLHIQKWRMEGMRCVNWQQNRFKMVSPCGRPCSTGTQNETVKRLTPFSAIINGIMMESWLQC